MDFYCIFKVVQPFLQDKVNLHDSCGVNNLHGIPGILGGLLRLKIKLNKKSKQTRKKEHFNSSLSAKKTTTIIKDAEGRMLRFHLIDCVETM